MTDHWKNYECELAAFVCETGFDFSVRDMRGFLSLLRINTNPLNTTAHVCVCGRHRRTAAGQYKEIRCQKSWMTLFCCQFLTGFVDNFLLGTWQWHRKGSVSWWFKADTHSQTNRLIVQMSELDSVRIVELHFWAQVNMLLFIIVMAEKTKVKACILSDRWQFPIYFFLLVYAQCLMLRSSSFQHCLLFVLELWHAPFMPQDVGRVVQDEWK